MHSVTSFKKMKNFLFSFFALLIGIFIPLSSTSQVLNMGGGSTYAVVVGISDYQDEGIPDLRFADKDAEAFANFLRSPAGGELDEHHLKLMTNEQVTLGKFDAALWWLVDECKEGDKVIIYFSGHGDVERRSVSQPGFLLCWDAPPLAYTGGGTYSLFFLKDIISTLSIQNKVKVTLITDACRSGKLAGSSIGGAQATAANLAGQFANEIKILSCQPDEYSIEGEQWGGGRGAFSYHLLEGLLGMADGNADNAINLKEISRYLEDNVTTEVAPENQNPMVIGSKTENLAYVFPELLAQLQEGKKGQMELFTATESRGIEDDVFETVDSTIQEQFYAFQKALEEKVFLSPANTCADFYYKQLIQEPKLEKLHNSMRRNFAAALQDDAQQVLKKMMENDPEESNLSKATLEAKYKSYPAYLQRAAELLGSEHYIYPSLQARKHYFEGYLMHINLRNADPELGKKILAKYREALVWQPNFPQAYYSMEMVHFHQMVQRDSAAFYAEQAMNLAPTWVRPYSNLAFFYADGFIGRGNGLEKAKYFLELADQVDSTASQSDYIHINNQASYYYRSGQLEKAVLTYKKAIKLDSSKISAPNNLGGVYNRQGNLAGAEEQYKKAIDLDSTNNIVLTNLGLVYFMSNRMEAAEVQFKKALKLDSTFVSTLTWLGTLYSITNRIEEGEKFFLKIIELDTISIVNIMTIARYYSTIKQYEKAEKYYKKIIRLDSTLWVAYSNLGGTYQKMNEWDKALDMAKKAIALGPPVPQLYTELGEVYMQNPEQFKDAEAAFNKALEIDSNSPQAYFSLSQFALKKKQPEAAWEYLEQALEKNIGKGGQLRLNSFDPIPDFDEMKKEESRWGKLMEKYFPDQTKD
jgi:tetratricopeptide (TPR) repeat protein